MKIFWNILLLGIYTKKTKAPIQRNISILMLITELFTIAKIWEQLECSSIDE